MAAKALLRSAPNIYIDHCENSKLFLVKIILGGVSSKPCLCNMLSVSTVLSIWCCLARYQTRLLFSMLRLGCFCTFVTWFLVWHSCNFCDFLEVSVYASSDSAFCSLNN